MSERKVLHLIGNAHLDPVWLWRWPEGFEAARATFESALDRMDEEPEFVFTSSQAAVYQWIERGDPDLFARIKAKVKEGRWRIVGGWWMQTDCNIPGGESLVRQGLYGQRYFQEKLGVMARVGYNVDSFGHNWMTPQILKGLGMDSYVFMRPGPHENGQIPSPLFWWEGPDGSRVLAFKIPRAYGGDGEWMEQKLLQTAREMEDQDLPEMMEFYGVGDHGGGPTKDNLARINRLKADPSLPELRYSSPEQFFDSIAGRNPDLPVWRDEMQHHASGCYAAHSEIKRNNRAAEHLLETAEKLSTVAAAVAGFEYPRAELTRAWQAVLFNQFHDILAGTSIKEAYDDARNLHGLALQMAQEAVTFAAGAIARQVDTTGEGAPIMVFNPNAWPVSAFCECELQDFGVNVRLEDDEGNAVPCQVGPGSAAVCPGGRTQLIFPAEVGGLGYRMYRAFPEVDRSDTDLTVRESCIENAFLKVEIDPATGQITGILDKRRNAQMLAAPSEARVIDDPSDTWSHGVFRFDKVIGAFGDADMEILERGPVRAAIRAASRFGKSRLVQECRLYAGSPWLECDCTVYWHEQRKMLKLTFPVNAESPTVTYEIQYGHIQRPADGEEEPGLRWVDVSGRDGGLCLLNDAKYSYSAEGSTINLTVLRSPAYAHHDPFVLEPNGHYNFTDQGCQQFRYRLLPHAGAWQEALPHRAAWEMNAPLLAVLTSRHAGQPAPRGSFVRVSAENAIVSALKRAEDTDGIIVRCFETHGRPADCIFKLAWPPVTWEAGLKPCEIKTFLVTKERVMETDLLERPI